MFEHLKQKWNLKVYSSIPPTTKQLMHSRQLFLYIIALCKESNK